MNNRDKKKQEAKVYVSRKDAYKACAMYIMSMEEGK